ncbi:hypothetical protein AGMMS49975_09580 [Clostridia bacterium]|nr:hypothetical protein AGMMS49975_09580 [Clostridia bacterium]
MSDSKKHALLSPSAAHRWVHCPPSARLCENIEDKGSSYAAEGTNAHTLSEYKLMCEMGDDMSHVADVREHLTYYSDEMEEATDDYVNFCMGEYGRLKQNGDAQMFIEQRVRYEEYVPHGSGSADCLIIGNNEMVVCDLKYGALIVEAEDNPQLKLYALGCLLAFDSIYNIETVKMCIIQPRRENISTVTVDKESLYPWAEKVVKPAAELAWNGDGEQCTGSWCQFCKIKATCRTRAKANMDLAKHEFKDPPLLETAEISAILDQSDKFKNWIKDVENFALTEALKGIKFPRYKVVEGRSNRRYSNETEVAKAAMSAGFVNIYTAEILGITAMEKLLGKKTFGAVLGSLIEKPQGKPTLVSESDKRKEINVNTAVEDFAEDLDEEIEN